MTKFRKAFVTGGAGFIGGHLVARLAREGWQVTVLDLRDPEKPTPGVRYVRGDVRNAELLGSLLEDEQVVFHFAATVSVPICQRDPIDSYSNNFQATLTVLEAIRARAEKRGRLTNALVFASTAALYGAKGDDGRALSETDIAIDFSSYYAAQKHASEQAIQLYFHCHKIPATVFRFFNVFGPGQDPTSPYSGVITVFARFAREGKTLPLNGGGTQTRDFISVYDIVEANVRALEKPIEQWDPSPMNLGTGASITVRELAQTIRDVARSSSEIVSAPPRDGDVLHSKANVTRARERLGFVAKVGLAEGLAELLRK